MKIKQYKINELCFTIQNYLENYLKKENVLFQDVLVYPNVSNIKKLEIRVLFSNGLCIESELPLKKQFLNFEVEDVSKGIFSAIMIYKKQKGVM